MHTSAHPWCLPSGKTQRNTSVICGRGNMSKYKVVYDAIHKASQVETSARKPKTIWSACQQADIFAVREILLKRKEATANQKNAHGNTPLYYTVQAARKYEGDLEKMAMCVRIAIILLQPPGRRETADIHAVNLIGESPLYLACKYSPIMASLFKKYVKWKGAMTKEEELFLLKSRETGIERLHEQQILKREWALQMNRQREEAKRALVKRQRQDENMKLHKNGVSKTRSSKAKRVSRPEKLWRNGWNKKDIFLSNIHSKFTTNQKLLEYNRHIRVRDRLDLMRLKTVEAYDKRKAENIRSRLYRIERQKRYHKEMASYYRRRPHSSYIRDRKSRSALMHIHRVEENRRMLHSMPIAKPTKQPKDCKQPLDLRKKVPAGFFRLDKEQDIKEAFNILADGKRFIDKNKLIKILSTRGDALKLSEAFDMLERVEGFTLAENINNIDYETFVEAMMWISKQEDLKDSATISKINKSEVFTEWH